LLNHHSTNYKETDHGGRTPLYIAMRKGFYRAAEKLISKGALENYFEVHFENEMKSISQSILHVSCSQVRLTSKKIITFKLTTIPRDLFQQILNCASPKHTTSFEEAKEGQLRATKTVLLVATRTALHTFEKDPKSFPK
jgi:hypothetical protein